jgi:hypothetical protein
MRNAFSYAAGMGAALLATTLALTLSSCSTPPSASTSSGRSGVVSGAPAIAPLPSPNLSVQKDGSVSSGSAPSPSQETASTSIRLIVVNKTLRIETSDVDAALAKVRDLAARDGGDITDLQVATKSGDTISPPPVPLSSGGQVQPASVGGPLRAYVTVRVPSRTYQAFVAEAAKLGRVLFQSESAQDVTQQHVDLTARLANLKAEEARLRQMFAKATNVRDALLVEQELSRVQGDIESLQGQIDYLARQAAMATVTIELAEPTPIVSSGGTDWGVGTAFTDAIRAFVATMNGLIVILGPVLALLVFVGLPIALIVWLVVKMLGRRRAKAAAETDAR